ncbi:MAG TPA: glucose dehydrogenase [Verrucomicrobiae bacterium]
MGKRAWVLLVCILALTSGCYVLRPSTGGGKTTFTPPRQADPNDVALPNGYKIEVVAQNLTFPTGVTFDESGQMYVVESGYCYGEVFNTPKLLRVGEKGATTQVAVGATNGPWTGVTFHDGDFYVSEGGVLEGGKILRISKSGETRAIVEGMPSFGDHHTDAPVVHDGWIYFGQGTASNSGIVGEDNAKFGWLKRNPDFHDIPAHDVTLLGEAYKTRDVISTNKSRKEMWTTGFAPYGSGLKEPIVKGQLKASGAIYRVKPDGADLQLVAWGFRNPFSLAFGSDGQLYATDNGYDERGSRPIWGAPDLLWRVQPNTWYGWPDFSGNEPVYNGRFTKPFSKRPKALMAKHPNIPPAPITKFPVHSSADGIDFSHNEKFGHVGEAFVALFGDQATDVGKLLHPVGFSVVRVNTTNGVTEIFAINKKDHGPASKIKGNGLERPVSVKFNPAGDALYIVDFGVLIESGGAKPETGTGVIWKITRTNQ